MKTSERFTNAVTKLYNAYHQNRLKAWDCSACAVGNICDNSMDWSNNIRTYYSDGFIDQRVDSYEPNVITEKSGYSVKELAKIEKIFLKKTIGDENKDTQFKGLCAVVEYLCELEGIPNVMDYTSLFETENDKPKHQLQEVF